MLHRFLRNRSGATAIEYGLMIALISLGVITAVIALGDQIAALFQSLADYFTNTATGTP